MPELCAFDDALAAPDSWFDYGTGQDAGMREDEYNTSADWFEIGYSFSPFGNLNPKTPHAPTAMPVGAVQWGGEEDKQLAPLGPWSGFVPDYYNYDVSNLELQVNEGKEEKEIKHSGFEPATTTTHKAAKAKKDKTEGVEKHHSTGKEIVDTEKKKRGRPRLKTGVDMMSWETTAAECNLSAKALTDRPADLYNFAEDDLVSIGSYSKAVRRGKIARFKAKKLRALYFEPHIRFAFRKQFAGARPRVGGRFVKMYPSADESDKDMLAHEPLSETDGPSEADQFPDPPLPQPVLVSGLSPLMGAPRFESLPSLESF